MDNINNNIIRNNNNDKNNDKNNDNNNYSNSHFVPEHIIKIKKCKSNDTLTKLNLRKILGQNKDSCDNYKNSNTYRTKYV